MNIYYLYYLQMFFCLKLYCICPFQNRYLLILRFCGHSYLRFLSICIEARWGLSFIQRPWWSFYGFDGLYNKKLGWICVWGATSCNRRGGCKIILKFLFIWLNLDNVYFKMLSCQEKLWFRCIDSWFIVSIWSFLWHIWRWKELSW